MTTSNEKKNILLCVAGMTPQIITETLYGLTQVQKVPVHEIRAITTIEGRNRILSSLLRPGDGILDQFCRDFRIDRSTIRFDENCIALLRRPDGLLLDDVRTPEENEFAGDQICEIVRELCRDPRNRIFASAAGGRKTMSIYLSLAMSLFARAEDTLSHVLVSAEFENSTGFYYPRPEPEDVTVFDPATKETRRISTAAAQVHIAPIQFIRFRGTELAEMLSTSRPYSSLVASAQSFLDKDERRLPVEIDLCRKTISVDGSGIRVTGYELLLYVMFAQFRLNGRGVDGLVLIKEIRRADFEAAFNLLMKAEDSDECLGEGLEGGEWEFLWDLIQILEDDREKFVVHSRRKFMNSVIRAIGRLNAKLEAFPMKYRISDNSQKRPKRYGLAITADLIVFSESGI